MFARLLALLLLLTLDPLKSFAAQPDHRMSNSVVQIQGAEAGDVSILDPESLWPPAS